MARPTRAQRRARREAQAESGVAPRAARARPQVRPTQAVKSQTGGVRVPGGGVKRFVVESWGELRKVDWPGQNQVIQGTVVVLIACIIVGVFLWINDLAWRRVIQDVLLR